MSTLSIVAFVCALAVCANGAAVRDIKLAAPALPLGVVRVGGGGGDSASEMDGQIVGGRDAAAAEFPHQVSMQIVLPGETEPEHMCGGTLVAADWVLTAAHCVLGVPSLTERVDAVVGITDLTKSPTGSQRITVAKMVVHPKYDPNLNYGVGPYDIAMLKLSSPARLSDTVKVAKLPAAGAMPSGDAVLSGWGSTSSDGYNPVFPNELQAAVFPIITFNTCYDMISKYMSPNPLAETNLCVGPVDRAGLCACGGDSGGPLVQKEGDEAVVIGVVSWGVAMCGSIPFPSMFTRVSAFTDWIAATQSSN